MVIGKIKPVATIVAQFAACVEVDAIQHEGRLFLPVVGLGEFSPKEEVPERPAATSPKSSSVKESPAEEASSTSSYTEEALMDMDVKELLKICKNEFGINPDDSPGKNTNKKLRNLILEAQENGSSESDDEDDSKDEEDGGDTDELTDKVAGLLEDFDGGKKNKKKTISTICNLSDDADEDAVTELVEEFENDGDADLDEMAEKIADVLRGKKKKPASKKREKKSKDKDLVSPEDLEVGDRVSVWWDDDNQEWFDGEVKSIKKGKITIAYDDDTEEVIDPEVHTKIKKLAE